MVSKPTTNPVTLARRAGLGRHAPVKLSTKVGRRTGLTALSKARGKGGTSKSRSKHSLVVTEVLDALSDGERQEAAKNWDLWHYATQGAPFDPVNREWTGAACERVREMAAYGQLKKTVAAHFGVLHKTFEEHLKKNKGENLLNYAWEIGEAADEQYGADLLLTMARGNGKGATIALLFYMKARHNWRDRYDGPSIVANAVTLTLPRSLTMDELLARKGMTAPVEVGGLKDITPVVAQIEGPHPS